MESITSRRFWRAAAATAAGAMVALSLSAIPASAAPVVDSAQNGNASITVHKFVRPEVPTELPNNGTPVDTSTLTPLADIEFTIQQVNTIDLTKNADWERANELAAAFDPADPSGSVTGQGLSLGAGTSATTLGDGTAAFPNLSLGLYLVSETKFPAGVTPSAPFLVSVPLTDPRNQNTWLYNVHVYPKNSITTATKTVQDSSVKKLGDELTFTIKADVPNEAIIDGYKITDKLDAKLDYVGAAVTLVDGGPALTLTTDYTAVLEPVSNTLTVEFTAAGRTILQNNNSKSVQVIVTAKANAVGEISNSAVVYPNNASFALEPGVEGGPVTTAPVLTKWGSMTLQKNSKDGKALAGASFSVYGSEADAKAGTNPLTLGGQSIFTVSAAEDGTKGQLTIAGLRYSDWANGAAVASGAPGYNTYYLVEVKAPDNYELLAAPVPFTITADTTVVGVDNTVVNVPSNGGFKLPLTGGPGTVLLYGAGVLVLAGAVLLFARSRRIRSIKN